MQSESHTKEEILRELKNLLDEHGKLTQSIVKQESCLSLTQVRNKFNSFSKAKAEAGVLRAQTKVKWEDATEEEILDGLRECYEKEGKITQSILLEKNSYPTPSYVNKHFETLSMAKIATGINDLKQIRLSDEQLEEFKPEFIEQIERCEEKYGIVSEELIRENDEFWSPVYIRRAFGTFNKAKSQADLRNKTKTQLTDKELREIKNELGKEYKISSTEYDKEEIIDILLNCQSRFGEVKTRLIEKHYSIKLHQIRKEFGTFVNAKYQADISDTQTHRHKWEQSSKEELIDSLERCYEKYGRVSEKFLDEDDELPHSNILISEFGSLSSAKIKTDIDDLYILLEGLEDKELKNVKEYQKKAVLDDLYHKQGMNQTEIAKKLGCNQGSISHYMKKFDIKTRSGAEANLGKKISVSKRQHEILTGILMSDGWASYGNPRKTAKIQVDMITEEFITWLKEQMGDVCGDIYQREPNNKKHKTQYRLSTRCLEEFVQYREWYSSGEKVWPEDIKLTPLTLKMLFVGDGTAAKTHSGSKFIKICLKKERENKEKIEKMFERVGFEVKWHGYSIRFTVQESRDIWEYMGSPPPGFEYKWPENMLDD